ncbi:hypothetical protein [Streptomyces sp. NPDC002564]|uniref:hypothetical protein n=1 Tax=Streptomyces sp. NPDC002564 TaxID=3364649 RepID=UPI00367831B2
MQSGAITGAETAVCERHGDALLSLALLLCHDDRRAVTTVADTIAQVCAAGTGPSSEVQERQGLVAYLWRRCAPESAMLSFPRGGDRTAPVRPVPAWSYEQERALMGLLFFGRLTCRQVAELTGVPARSVALQLRSILRRAEGVPDYLGR